jgi:hypothetical protein
MTNISPAPAFGFIDNAHAPDVYADAATGFFVFANNLRITFESLRVSHVASPGPVNRVVIGRLIIPLEQAEAMAKGILDMIEKQRNQPQPSAQSTPTLQ